MYWCFGILNGRLAEIYFAKSKGKLIFEGHAYVDETEYRTKSEKRWIKKDSENLRLIYRLGKYRKVKI